MARFLFAWELGSGFGHVAPHLAVIDGLIARGHQIKFAMRTPVVAEQFFGRRDVQCLQAPVHHGAPANPAPTPLTYAQILQNCGYDDSETLLALARAWRALFESVRPDVTIFDHAPTAALASIGLPFRRVGLGTGFYIPPDIRPLPNLRPSIHVTMEELCAEEDRTLETMNSVLKQLRVDPLERVADLFRLDARFFRTFPELDHYRERRNAEYIGMLPAPAGATPTWPPGKGGRTFVYLKNAGVHEVLHALHTGQRPALIFVPGLDRRLKDKFSAPHLLFTDQPPDLSLVAKDCDLAILNGSHDTMAQFLLAGVPLINLPLHLEQSILATRAAELGAGLYLGAPRADLVRQAMMVISQTNCFHLRAAEFAARYRAHDATAQLERLLNRLDDLAGKTGIVH